jgi:4-amino-4-deoxy-L-arabinose transferase-like glycosyltransferase
MNCQYSFIRAIRGLVSLASAWFVARPILVVFCISLTCGFLFFYRLADRDLWSSHEGRAAQNASTILREGHWGLPKLFDGHPELQKPPLYYWLVALIAQVRGGTVDGWAVRLPAALSALGGVLLVLVLLASRGRPIAGLIAALVLATAMHYTWLARVGRIDMPLTLTVGVALVCFYLASNSPHAAAPVWFILRLIAYMAIAAAIMLKGPIGAVLPAVVLVLHAIVERMNGSVIAFGSRRNEGLPSLLWGIPLVLALTVPWFCWANCETNGEFFRVFFWHHNVERGFGGSDDLRVHPFWFYGPRWLIDFLPWSPLVLLAAWYLLRCRRWGDDAEARFGLVWLVGVVVLLSCARFKRSDYLLPAYPGAAMLVGCVAEKWLKSATRPHAAIAGFATIVVGCLVSWWVLIGHVLPAWEPSLDQRPFAREIRQHVGSTYLHFFRAESHALAFHLGYPIDTFLEWENLDIWAGRPGTHYIVMPADCAAEWPDHITSGRLVAVLRNTDLADGIPPHQQLVLMRTDPSAP